MIKSSFIFKIVHKFDERKKILNNLTILHQILPKLFASINKKIEKNAIFIAIYKYFWKRLQFVCKYFQNISLAVTKFIAKVSSQTFLIHFININEMLKKVSQDRKFIFELVIIFIRILLSTSQKI